MSAATSASDRYDAARATLARFRDRTAKLGRSVETPLERELADALAPLIEPAATFYAPEQIAAQVRDKHPESWKPDISGRYTVGQLTTMMQAAVHAGIQAAWESWEPETAPGLPSGSLETLAAEAGEALEAISASTDTESMDDVFEARDKAADVLIRFIAFTKTVQED